MKYCIGTTQNHPISLSNPTSLEDINLLLTRECKTPLSTVFINGEIVLDLDSVEAVLAASQKRLRNRSMDITFGISNADSSIRMMVMVEIRLNYTNPYNLNRQILEEKVNCSLMVLTNSIPIYSDFIFLFQTNIKQEAKNRLFRMNPRVPNNYIVMDLEDLKQTFFD